jgi:ribosome-binding factor A
MHGAAIKRHVAFARKKKCGPQSLHRFHSSPRIASRAGFVDSSDMPTRRTVRVAEVLRKELAACMNQSLDLEGLLVTISSIELPPDMKQAFVYVSTLNPELDQEKTLALLTRNRKEWQGRIGRRLGAKFTPQLIFRFDNAIERGDRVMEILTKLDLEKENTSHEKESE